MKLAKRQSELDRLGVRLVAISVDTAADSKALRERLGVSFPLVHDEGARVAEAYGVAMKNQELAVPATILVGADGVIAWQYVGETPADRPPEDVVFDELAKLVD